MCVYRLEGSRRHLNPSQAAVAEAKRAKLSEEYAAEVKKMKEAEAAGRKAQGGGDKKSETARAKSAPHFVGEPIDKHDGETSTSRP